MCSLQFRFGIKIKSTTTPFSAPENQLATDRSMSGVCFLESDTQFIQTIAWVNGSN